MKNVVKFIIIVILTAAAAFIAYSLLQFRFTGHLPLRLTYLIVLPLHHWIVLSVFLFLCIITLYCLFFRMNSVRHYFRSIPQNIKQSLNAKSFITLIPLILAPFTFFLLGPIEMVVRNAVNLRFSWVNILPIVLITFAICILLLCFIGITLPEKARRYYIALIWGGGLALYVEGNLLPIDYGILDGRPVAWEELTLWAIINSVIWCIFLILPILATRFWHEFSRKVMIYITCVIVVLQVGTVVYHIVQPSPQRDRELIVTEEYLWTVSEHQNVVIMVLDGFDVEYMNILLEEEPELAEKLDNFVFFDNTLGLFQYTYAALPHILTSQPFLNEMPYWDYLDHAFNNAAIYPKLREQNFDIFIHTDPFFISPQAADYVSNIHIVDGYIVDDTFGFTESLFRFVSMRYFPHILKESIWKDLIGFDAYLTTSEHGAGLPSWPHFDIHFYNTMISDGLDITPYNNVFSIIHMEGVHPSSSKNRFVQEVGRGEAVTRYDIARGALQIVIDYTELLKQVGLIENTLLIVIADHGQEQMRQRPLLLVRDPSVNAPFSVSSAPMSLKNIMPMLEAYLAGESTALDYLYAISGGQDIRTFYDIDSDEWFTYWHLGLLPGIREYSFITGNDISDAQFTGIIHEGIWAPAAYKLGDIISFSHSYGPLEQISHPQRFFRTGLTVPGGDSSWTIDKEIVFMAHLEEPVVSDLQMNIVFEIYGDSQTIRLSTDERLIREMIFQNTGDWQETNFIIPRDAITDNNILEIRFEFPDAVLYEGTEHFYAIELKEMSITPVE